jgi:hypothetical protein
MTTLYFLDAAEFTDVSAVAAAQPGARVERLPGYVTITSDGPLVIDRRAAGVRHAIWYSAKVIDIACPAARIFIANI